jgi:hypothetical protein
MKAWTIVAWTYEADIHCPRCARERFGDDIDEAEPAPEDSEGNEVRPVFASDELSEEGEYCGTCGDEIAEPWGES